MRSPVLYGGMADPFADSSDQRPLTVLFATETGNAMVLAEKAVAAAAALGVLARLADMATYNTTRLERERDVLVISSTHGEGDPPFTAIDFFEYLDEACADLSRLRYAVLALGDSGYDHFCEAGRRLDCRFAGLGARRLAARRDVDVDEMKAAREWVASLVGLFATS